MSDDLEKVKIKIKKLLAMAENGSGDNTNEAATAAKMAARLMDQYQISHADMIKVELKKGDGLVGEAINDLEFTAWPLWLQSLAVYVCEAFECQGRFTRSGQRKKKMKIQGYKADVQMVHWLYGFLYEELTRLAKKEVGIQRSLGNDTHANTIKNSFLSGAVDILQYRLQEITDARKVAQSNAGTDLMVVKADAIALRFGTVKYGQRTTRHKADMSSYYSGQEAGKNVNLNRPMEGNKQGQLS